MDFFDRYEDYEYPLACLQLVFFMLGMGANLLVADFAKVLRQPRALVIGLVCQLALSPLVAVLVSRAAGLEAGISVGLILAALMPGGALSKVFTYLGRGNIALSITLAAVTTLATVVVIPVALRTLAARHVPEDFQVPPEIVVREVGLFLLLPLLAGMGVGRLAPRWRHAFARWCLRAGLVFVALMIVGALGSGRIHPWDYGWQTPLTIILFCVGMQQLSMLPFYLFGGPRADRLSVGVEVTMRNMNLALLLKAVLFPAGQGQDPVGDGVLFVSLYYAAVALVAGLLLTLNHRRLHRQDQARASAGGEPV